jgi:uncharacterized Tic20 family protein
MTQMQPGQTPPPAPAPGPPPAPGDTEVRNWTVIAHVSALSGIITAGLGCIVGPLLVWLYKGKTNPTIETHAKAALNFQITMVIAMAVAFALMFVFIGVILMPLLGLFDLICVILATVKASNGELFQYPLSLKLIK